MKLLWLLLPVIVVVLVLSYKPKVEIPNTLPTLITVSTPLPHATVSSPIVIEGRARGTWFFEASFPIELTDSAGAVLGTAIAQAQSDWMTEDFVPFKAELTYQSATAQQGTLILKKDNPSGLPEHDASITIPLSLQQTSPQRMINVYYYNPDKDKDASGNIMCSRAGLVSVQRTIPLTITPIQDAVNELLKGELTAQERGEGITTEYPLPEVKLTSASLKDGTLTLQFSDPLNKTGGGSCRVGILWFQIEATAKQFDGVKSVRFIPEELFQP